MERAVTARAEYRTLREIVQERLVQDIVEARLKPGQKLVEADLAQTYGVSRGPVREAIRALEGQGLVHFASNRGVVVTSLYKQQIREIYEIRIELEGLAARLAAQHITTELVDLLRQFLDRMDASTASAETWIGLNDEFHLTLYRASERPRLCGLISDLMATIQPYARLYVDRPDRLADTHADHHLLLQAAAARDPERCEAIAQLHLRRAAEIIVDMVGDGA